MSISQNFPSTRPSLNLNFARSQKLDPRITFTRTSSATRVNSDGLIEVVPANSPRFDHDPVTGECLGLLIEEQRTNNIQVSAPAPADISNSVGTEGWLDRINPIYNLEFSSVTSPDGTNNAVGVAYTSAYSNFQIPFLYNQQSLLSSNTTYTLSFWVDDTELVESNGYHLTTIIGTNAYSGIIGRYFRINYNKDTDTFSTPIYSTGSSVTAENADTTFPSANISGKVERYPNNWKRISITFKVDSSYDGFYDSGNTLADARFTYGIYMGVSGATNDNVGNSMSTWGWQLEQGSFPTSYIPTSGSTASRNPDNVSITGQAFQDFYNQSEGTVYTRYSPYTQIPSLNNTIFCFELSSNNAIRLLHQASTGRALYQVQTPGGLSVNLSRGVFTFTAKEFTDLSISYAQDDFVISGFGGISEDDSGDVPIGITNLKIGNTALFPTTYSNGHISQLIYYPVRLSNDQLITLTK